MSKQKGHLLLAPYQFEITLHPFQKYILAIFISNEDSEAYFHNILSGMEILHSEICFPEYIF